MTVKVEPLKDLEEQVYCSHCKGKRNHKIIKSYEESSDSHSDFHWHANYQIIKCSGCNRIAFVEQYGDEDTWEYIGGVREWKDVFTVYPEEPKVENPDDLLIRLKIEVLQFKHAPENIFNLYKQIVESYNSQHLILSTSGLRTLVEGICSQLEIKNGYNYDKEGNKILEADGEAKKSGSLGGRIFGLYENGYIIFPQALILQRVKIIGNSAIHDIVTPHLIIVKRIIHVVEKVMDDIYELKNHTLLKD